MGGLLNWVLDRAREPSTWASLAAGVGGGVSAENLDDPWKTVAQVLVALLVGIGVIRGEGAK